MGGLFIEGELESLNERFTKLQQDFENQLSISQQLEMEVNTKQLTVMLKGTVPQDSVSVNIYINRRFPSGPP
jgi:hypothetical protein